MPGRHWRVGREDTARGNGLDRLGRQRGAISAPREFLLQQRQDQQRRVPFVQVKPCDRPVPQGPQHPDTAETQNRFLVQAVRVIPAVQDIRQGSILGSILLQIGVEEVHGHDMSGSPLDLVTPGSDLHGPAFEFNRHAGLHRLEKVIHGP